MGAYLVGGEGFFEIFVGASENNNGEFLAKFKHMFLGKKTMFQET